MDIVKANRAIVAFLKELLDAEEVKVVSASKSADGWIGTAEVYEESAFIKSVGLKTEVKDRNTYEVELDADFSVVAYTRIEEAD